VPLHQSGHIKLGLLDHLDLSDVTVLDGEDARGLTLNLLARGSSDKCLHQGLEVTLPGEGGHGVDHLSADGADLGALGITRLLELIVLLLGEGDAEHAHNVPVRGSGVYVGLDNALLFLDEGAQLVARDVHTVEVEEAVEPLNILDTKLDLTVRHGLVVVEVGEGELNDTALESIRGDLGTLCLGDDGLAALLGGEDGGSDELVPLFLEEGVGCLLLAALLGLGESLILSL